MTTECGLASPRDIDEKVGAFDIGFVAEFSEKYSRESGRSAWIEVEVENGARCSIDDVRKDVVLSQPIRTVWPF